jgi:hypothetical protein
VYTDALEQRGRDLGTLNVFSHSGRIQVEIAANLVPAEHIEAVRSLLVVFQLRKV